MSCRPQNCVLWLDCTKSFTPRGSLQRDKPCRADRSLNIGQRLLFDTVGVKCSKNGIKQGWEIHFLKGLCEKLGLLWKEKIQWAKYDSTQYSFYHLAINEMAFIMSECPLMVGPV